MTIPMRYAPRRAQIPYVWLLVTAAAALIAVGPIVAALVSTLGGGAATAFASAPRGDYAVVAGVEGTADVIFAVSAADGEPREIGRVEHLPGYGSYGAVAPDGRRLALVVVDGGAQARPLASVVVVDLESGQIKKIAANVDYLQTPVWAPDGGGVVVTRSKGGGADASVQILQVAVDGSGEANLATVRGALGGYPVGFDKMGRLVYVVIDSRGSTLYRGGNELALLSSGITRDWRLNADASAIAFIETRTDGGVEYAGRVVVIEGGVAAQSLVEDDGVESLGVAWRSASAGPTFGRAPGASSVAAAQAGNAAGFDVPLAYSANGDALAVQRWTGASFDEPGEGSLEIVRPDGQRLALAGYGRFFGWAAR